MSPPPRIVRSPFLTSKLSTEMLSLFIEDCRSSRSNAQVLMRPSLQARDETPTMDSPLSCKWVFPAKDPDKVAEELRTSAINWGLALTSVKFASHTRFE